MIEPLTDFRRAVISGIEESAVLQISIAAVAHFPKDQLWLSVYQGKERNLVCAILPGGAYRQFRHTIAVEVLYCIADHIRRFVSPTLPHFLGGYEEVLFTDSISIGESVRVHRQGTKPLNQLVISRIGGGRNTDGLEITVHKGSARPCIRICVHIWIVPESTALKSDADGIRVKPTVVALQQTVPIAGDLRVPDQNLRPLPQGEHSVIVVKPAVVKDRLRGFGQAENATCAFIDLRADDSEARRALRPDAVGAAAKQVAVLHRHALGGGKFKDISIARALFHLVTQNQALQDRTVAIGEGHHICIPVLGDQAHGPALLRFQGEPGGVIDVELAQTQNIRIHIATALRNLLLFQGGKIVVAGFQNNVGIRGDDADQLGDGRDSDCIVLRIVLRIDFRYLLRSRGIGCGRLLRILCLTAGRQRGQQQER